VDGIGSGSCPMAGFIISGAAPSSPATTATVCLIQHDTIHDHILYTYTVKIFWIPLVVII